MIVRAAHLCSPMPGEIQNGDAVVFRQTASGDAILAVIDGLGHGPEAAAASRAGVQLLELMPAETNVHDAMQELHRELRGTRGAAATVAIIRNFKLEICAVGNVALMCVSCAVPLVVSAGVLGHQVHKFRICTSELNGRARLALLSDGVSLRFRLEDFRTLEPAGVCEEIMKRYRRKEDDASVLVADVRD